MKPLARPVADALRAKEKRQPIARLAFWIKPLAMTNVCGAACRLAKPVWRPGLDATSCGGELQRIRYAISPPVAASLRGRAVAKRVQKQNPASFEAGFVFMKPLAMTKVCGSACH